VRFELKHARLHERGVCALPVWVVDYECLGQRWRAFVSALEPRSGRIAVAGMRHASPWADMASSSVGSPLTADGAFSWKILGQMRTDDAQTNTDWRVQRYWLDEVSRVMPDEQKPSRSHAGAGSRGFRSFVPGGGEVSEAHYELLGLVSTPPPSSGDIRAAFRRQCMRYHPDRLHARTAEEQAAGQEHFQRIVDAHRALRLRHPDYLDGAAA